MQDSEYVVQMVSYSPGTDCHDLDILDLEIDKDDLFQMSRMNTDAVLNHLNDHTADLQKWIDDFDWKAEAKRLKKLVSESETVPGQFTIGQSVRVKDQQDDNWMDAEVTGFRLGYQQIKLTYQIGKINFKKCTRNIFCFVVFEGFYFFCSSRRFCFWCFHFLWFCIFRLAAPVPKKNAKSQKMKTPKTKFSRATKK